MTTFADLLHKMADNARLTPQELDELKGYGTETQQRNSFVAGNTSADNTLAINFPFFPIYSETLQDDLASLTIQIPGEYKHLLIMGSGRINGTGGQTSASVMCQLNGDTGATNYMMGRLYHVGSTVTAEQDLSDPSMRLFSFTADGEATNSFLGAFFMFIPHYNSSYYKMILNINGVAFSTAIFDAMRQGLWLSTSKINSIKFFPDPSFASAKFQAGTLISVYGIY